MGAEQRHELNGNVMVPLEQRFGFGFPTPGNPQATKPTGPSFMTTDGDPNGVLSAPINSIAQQRVGAGIWRNTDGATTWELLAAGATVTAYKQRVVLADLPAALMHTVIFADALPANVPIIAALPFVSVAPAGGGVTTCICTIQASAPPGDVLFDMGELVGFPAPDYWNVIRDSAVPYAPRVDPSMYDVTAGARALAVAFTADVLLNTLAAFDVTAIVVVGPALTVP